MKDRYGWRTESKTRSIFIKSAVNLATSMKTGSSKPSTTPISTMETLRLLPMMFGSPWCFTSQNMLTIIQKNSKRLSLKVKTKLSWSYRPSNQETVTGKNFLRNWWSRSRKILAKGSLKAWNATFHQLTSFIAFFRQL